MAWHEVARPGLLLLLYAFMITDAMAKNLGEFPVSEVVSYVMLFAHPKLDIMFSGPVGAREKEFRLIINALMGQFLKVFL